MVAKNRFMLSLAFGAALLSGCAEDPYLRASNVRAYEQLRSLPQDELARQVIALPPTRQVELYVTAIRYYRPSDLRLTDILAKEGTVVLPALVAVLDDPNSASMTPKLVLVLYQMAVIYHVDEAKALAPRVHAWCSRPYVLGSYCEQMGREMSGNGRQSAEGNRGPD